MPTAKRATDFRRAIWLVTTLFFMWGLAYGLLDVLNKHFQELMGISRARSGLLQAAYFGAYFIMARPAAFVLQKRGFKACILLGLILYALGALGFVPATLSEEFPAYLAALFVIASGLAHLETAANPYIVLLGERHGAERRLNLSQSFNGLGSFLGPMVGGALFFNSTGAAAAGSWEVKMTYVVVGALALAVAGLIWRTPLPEFFEASHAPGGIALLRKPRFAASVIAQFFYVAAQVGVGAYFINYVTERHPDISSSRAAYLLSVGMALFLCGRFFGVLLMRYIPPARLLLAYAAVAMLLSVTVATLPGVYSLAALVGIFFFMSIMFPTIFALGVADLGEQTKVASSYLIMSIVGGAIVPYFMGRWADAAGIAAAYFVPAICFAVVGLFALLCAQSAPR
jgi:FHS family L-fucose permease-like MFS transporter